MKKTIVVLFLAIAFVTPAFAEGRYATITTDTTETGHSNYTETDGSGGVFLIENPVTLTIEDNSSFSSNTASKYGGVIELNNSNAIVNIGSKVSFDKNKSGVGGAIDIYAGTVTIGYGTSFNENKATATESGSGGAIFNEGEIISDFVYFRINSAKDQGGAILNRGKITMKDASFWYNSAENEGGAIYNDSSEDISFGDTVSFSDNLAKFGGAIYNNRGNINIGNDVKFEFNDAKTGGAIYNKGTINIGNNAIFLRNMLPSYNSCGGAIYNEKNITIGRNAYFEQNTSDAGAGAIYNCSGGNITFLDGVIFKANSSKTGGGAIYNEGTMNFMAKTTNVEFEYNGLSLSGDGSSNAIYNSGGTVNLWASNNADIIFNDRILGSSGEININNRIFDLQ